MKKVFLSITLGACLWMFLTTLIFVWGSSVMGMEIHKSRDMAFIAGSILTVLVGPLLVVASEDL